MTLQAGTDTDSAATIAAPTMPLSAIMRYFCLDARGGLQCRLSSEQQSAYSWAGMTMQGNPSQGEDAAEGLRTRSAKRALIDSIPGVYFVYNPEGKLIEWNQGYLDVVGITDEECFGRGTTTDIAVEDHAAAERSLHELATIGRTTTRAQMVHSKTGKRTPFFFSSRTVPDGDGYRIVGLGVDITATVETEHALRNEQAFLRSVLESSVDGFVVFDRDRVLVAHNRYFLSRGLFTEDPIGRHFDAAWIEEVARSMNDPATFYLNMTRVLEHPLEHDRFSFRTGDSRLLECVSAPVIDEDGEHLGQVLTYRDMTKLEIANRRYEYLATHDPVTGLLNRTAIFDLLQELIDSGQPFGVLSLDIDRFQRYNHTYGHLFGDEVLRLIGEQLVEATEIDHIVGREGGDEFLIIVPGDADRETLRRIAEGIFEQFATIGSLNGRDLDLRAHIGICVFPEHGTSLAELITHSDYAMTHSRVPGRNSVAFYTDAMGAELTHRIALEQQLRKAIASMAFHLVYQPKVDIATGRIVGIETLLRWHDPDLGWISPADFVPLAEETRLVLPLGDWILTTACRQMKDWLDRGICDVSIAVNVSMIQIYESDFISMIERILRETGLEGKYLEIELTETVLAQDPGFISTVVTQLRNLGILVSIDDFGTGYSSLSYLKDFQVDKMKIDQSFTQHIHQSSEDNAIIQTAISIARTLGLVTIAEGVETMEQLEFLRDSGCMRAQGFLFSRPVSPFEIERMFTDARQGVLPPQPHDAIS